MTFLVEGLDAGPAHCGRPMQYGGGRVRWEGDYEIVTERFRCSCGVTCNVESWTPSLAPQEA